MKELEELKKELEEALEKVNKKLEENEGKYYAIDYIDGNIYEIEDDNTATNQFQKSVGNYFKTEEEAEEYLEDLKVKAEIKKIAKELNNGKEIDWNNEHQDKIYLCYNYGLNFIQSYVERSRQAEGVIYCLNECFEEVVVERIGEKRLKNYLKRN